MTTKFQNPQYAHEFLMAGHAIVTLESAKTGTRFTFKVVAPKVNKNNIRFVNLLSGPDNTNDYTYMGIITANGQFKSTTNSKVGQDAPSWKAFAWVLNHLTMTKAEIPAELRIYHEEYCGRCGRLLTVPESVERGIGPECAKHM